MLHWLQTAFDTYILHSEHGNGYQWWSSGPGFLGFAQIIALWTLMWTIVRKHNCYEYKCLRVGTHRSQLDNHIRCRRHHDEHKQHPNYKDAKDLDANS